MEFQSNRDQTYHVLVHGVGGASANFTFSITSNRLANLSDLLVDYDISIQALQDRSTPQYQALEWMANDDSTDPLHFTLSDDELVERFVVVLLYFSMKGANWINQARFLSPSLNICSWNSTIDITIGVLGCNEVGSVVRLVLSKFPNSAT